MIFPGTGVPNKRRGAAVQPPAEPHEGREADEAAGGERAGPDREEEAEGREAEAAARGPEQGDGGRQEGPGGRGAEITLLAVGGSFGRSFFFVDQDGFLCNHRSQHKTTVHSNTLLHY